ncbi:hypothetical protein J3Q64DRAFT_1697076 [Phycomyces blakesleeanus]|uniref:Uncharacterized protein n=2 Tax=Phycomyces blakesleeanus TaxID=4837 RepID=A0A162U945_PHYB8|nr:hypothetical protein PHYBLDRAFT_167871 [Phycomyces blakesleeanus NRRL 1555(-)]OAD74462.1 hypothetical protein PHYBLDRAFT_167871 [Phycomyces blakesleeanus NRRL 1555(-)]|eukprot:XP_018292502.1 hypothetical protein PHYBLDRAFT_167871 [Phycomyces blakesleeanus NRRL 1555(-)]
MVHFLDKGKPENNESSNSLHRSPASMSSSSYSSSSRTPESISIAEQHNLSNTLPRMHYILLWNIILEALVVSALEAALIYYHVSFSSHCVLSITNMGLSLANVTHHGLAIITQVYQVLLYIDLLKQHNMPQLCMTMIFQTLILVFAIIKVYHSSLKDFMICDDSLEGNNTFSTTNYPLVFTRNDTEFYKTKFQSLEYAVFGVTLACSIVFLLCLIRLYRASTWTSHYLHSFDDNTKKAILAATALVSLLKFDAFFCFFYIVQLVPATITGYPVPYWEVPAVVLASALILLLGWYAVLKESSQLTLAFATATILSFGYFVYRIISLSLVSVLNQEILKIIRSYLQLSISITLVFTLLTIVVSLTCFLNQIRGINLPQPMCHSCTHPQKKPPPMVPEHTEPPYSMGTALRSEPKQSTDTCFFSDCHSVIK